MENKAKTPTFKIRPAGRHLSTIGKDLILDWQAAIIELAKNAFDADSPDISIKFTRSNDGTTNQIKVADTGHGMPRDSVLNNWLVPSTDNKKRQPMSPAGRVMQGRKGVGRYATAILGNDLLLETTDESGDTTTLYLDWLEFEKKQYLDEVEVLVETLHTGLPKGTTITINSPKEQYDWNDEEIARLRKELKKLRTSLASRETSRDTERNLNEFDIRLKVDIPNLSTIDEIIEPLPLFDFFDYSIQGVIEADGSANLTYTLNKFGHQTSEIIKKSFGATNCGRLVFDIRVFDRDSDSILAIIQKGLKDDKGDYLGRLETRRLLNEICGMGVYRNGFRIRPLGDAEFDWLELNKQRVQDPSRRIGSDQVTGSVLIESEDISGLIEKSARDGLRENVHFQSLKAITKEVIGTLEFKRRIFRQKMGLSKPGLKIEKAFEKIFSNDELREKVKKQFKKSKVPDDVAKEIFDEINRDEDAKNKVAEELKEAIAVYQGQATLGKIIHVLIHEGRRPLSYFVNQIPLLQGLITKFQKTGSQEHLEGIYSKTEGIQTHGKLFSDLFKKIDPLASGRGQKKIEFNLKDCIEKSFHVFSAQLEQFGITYGVKGLDHVIVTGFPQDAIGLFVNLIENSIYWMTSSNSITKHISITANLTKDGDIDFIDYRDSGPGISAEFIESEIIFEPNFSMKPNGTGLGLSIAGEVAHRLQLNLQALESNAGAYFRLSTIKSTND